MYFIAIYKYINIYEYKSNAFGAHVENSDVKAMMFGIFFFFFFFYFETSNILAFPEPRCSNVFGSRVSTAALNSSLPDLSSFSLCRIGDIYLAEPF